MLEFRQTLQRRLLQGSGIPSDGGFTGALEVRHTPVEGGDELPQMLDQFLRGPRVCSMWQGTSLRWPLVAKLFSIEQGRDLPGCSLRDSPERSGLSQ